MIQTTTGNAKNTKNTKLARSLIWLIAVVDLASLFLLCTASSAAPAVLVVVAVVNVIVFAYAASQGFLLEYRIEQKFKRVCQNVGLTQKQLKVGFYDVGVGAMLDPTFKRSDNAAVYPKLRGLVGNRQQWQAEIRQLPGQKLSDYTKHADAFALAFNVPFVSFELLGYGKLRIRAGQMAVPAPYAFQVQQRSSNYGVRNRTSTPQSRTRGNPSRW